MRLSPASCRLVHVGAFVFAAAIQPSVTHAGGLEYTGQGTQSLARGGAVAARASDPMTLAHNPAGLAELSGNQMLLDLNFAFFNACVDPAGYYGWGAYRGGAQSVLRDPETGQSEIIPLNQTMMNAQGQTVSVPEAESYYTGAYDTVCLEQNVAPIPQLAFSMRLTDRLGIGFGLIFPSVQPSGAWGGNGTGVIRGESGYLRPAATRYQLLVANNLGAFPNIGLGYRIADFLRVGLALEYGFIAVDTTTMAPSTGNTSPHNDIIAHVEAFDYWVPAATASVHLVPTDALDLVFAFRWQDSINAKGLTEFTTGYFSPTKTPTTTRVDVDAVRQNMPWKLRGGIRYASRRNPRSNSAATERDADGFKRIHDPLEDERWDIEFDVEYQLNGRNQTQTVEFAPDSYIYSRETGMTELGGMARVPNSIRIPKRWQNQISARLGGTANVIPGKLAVSAGAHYETRGVDPDYMQVDFWPLQRLGLHAGVTYRLSRTIDINLSYAHIFQETLIVAPPEHRSRSDIYAEYEAGGGIDGGTVRGIDQTSGAQIGRTPPPVLPFPSQGTPDGVAAVAQNATQTTGNEPPYITNAGRYRSSFDVIAVGANFHF